MKLHELLLFVQRILVNTEIAQDVEVQLRDSDSGTVLSSRDLYIVWNEESSTVLLIGKV